MDFRGVRIWKQVAGFTPLRQTYLRIVRSLVPPNPFSMGVF